MSRDSGFDLHIKGSGSTVGDGTAHRASEGETGVQVKTCGVGRSHDGGDGGHFDVR